MGAASDGSSVRNTSVGMLMFLAVAFAVICTAAVIFAEGTDVSDAGTNITVDGMTYEIISDDEVSVVAGSEQYSGAVTIPSTVYDSGVTYSVVSISSDAFSGCAALTSVEIEGNITFIGVRAFYNCESLTSIDLPNSVMSIGNYAFSGCTSLKSATIGSGSIGVSAFQGCVDLKTVVMGSGVTSIGDNAFMTCMDLDSVVVPDTVTSVGIYAFYGCISLTSLTITDNTTSIGKNAFCLGLSGNIVKCKVFYRSANTLESYSNEYTEFSYYFNVIFMSYDGSTILDTATVLSNADASYSGSELTKESTDYHTYTFAGWNSSPGMSTADPDILKNITAQKVVYAAFLEEVRLYDVIFRSQDGSTELDKTSVEYGSDASYPKTDPIMDPTAQYTYKFAGWNSSAEMEISDPDVLKNITAERTVYAVFSKTVNKYDVIFRSHDGSTELDKVSVKYGSDASYSKIDPTRHPTAQYTYTFTGWNPSAGKESADPDILKNITGGKTIYAAFSKTVNKYDIIFRSQDGSTELDKVTAEYGSDVTYTGSEPTKDPTELCTYSFAGWNTLKNMDVPGTDVLRNISADRTVYAVFSETVHKYTVTIDSENITVKNGDDRIASGSVIEHGTLLTVSMDPKKGCTDNITANGIGLSGDTYAVTEDVTFRGSYEAKQYPITLKANSGNSDMSITATYGEILPSFTAPERSGYLLKGYYTAEDGGDLTISKEGRLLANTPYSDGSGKWKYDGTSAFYAQWDIIEYTITYNVKGGTPMDRMTYTIESDSTVIPSASKEGYVFDGWYDNDEFSGESISEMEKGSTGDVTLYAKWKTVSEDDPTIRMVACAIVAIVAIVGAGTFIILRK